MSLRVELEARMDVLGEDIGTAVDRFGLDEEELREWVVNFGHDIALSMFEEHEDIDVHTLANGLSGIALGGFLLGLDYAQRRREEET